MEEDLCCVMCISTKIPPVFSSESGQRNSAILGAAIHFKMEEGENHKAKVNAKEEGGGGGSSDGEGGQRE